MGAIEIIGLAVIILGLSVIFDGYAISKLKARVTALESPRKDAAK